MASDGVDPPQRLELKTKPHLSFIKEPWRAPKPAGKPKALPEGLTLDKPCPPPKAP